MQALTGRAALGSLRVTGDGSPAAQVAFATALREATAALEGSLQVRGIDAVGEARAARLGPIGSAAAIGFSVKRRFDPSGVLPYPWERA